MAQCQRPPHGSYCSRPASHAGRCATSSKQTPLPQELESWRDELDYLISDVRAGIMNQSRYDDMEETAAMIGIGIRNAFRMRGL